MKAISSILVVEDNPIALKTLATLLTALGVKPRAPRPPSGC
jgi:CheY-like chemotaxis protein